MLIVPMDRNVLGTLNLGDILSQRESIAREMQVLSQPRVVPDREILNTKMGNTYVRIENVHLQQEGINCKGNSCT